jgi:hypothetical protein
MPPVLMFLPKGTHILGCARYSSWYTHIGVHLVAWVVSIKPQLFGKNFKNPWLYVLVAKNHDIFGRCLLILLIANWHGIWQVGPACKCWVGKEICMYADMHKGPLVCPLNNLIKIKILLKSKHIIPTIADHISGHPAAGSDLTACAAPSLPPWPSPRYPVPSLQPHSHTWP